MLLNLINPSSLNNMSDCVNDTVKPRRRNPACGFKLPDGQFCNKTQQYRSSNPICYCLKHYKEWFATLNAASACNITAESTSEVTTTTVDEYSAPIIAPSESGVPAGSTWAVESNTRTTVMNTLHLLLILPKSVYLQGRLRRSNQIQRQQVMNPLPVILLPPKGMYRRGRLRRSNQIVRQ